MLKRSIFDCSYGSDSITASPMQLSSPRSSTPGQRPVLLGHDDNDTARTPQKKHKASAMEVHQTPSCPVPNHETHTWLKPKRPQLGPRPVAISRSQVDTAPRIPSAAKMDMPIGLPSMSSSPVFTSTTTGNTAMAIRLPRRPLPRRVAAIQPREPRDGVSTMGEGAPPKVIQPPKLPAVLQLPDLPDIESPLENRNAAGIRAPHPALLMKPL